jgi:hypothetical protein
MRGLPLIGQPVPPQTIVAGMKIIEAMTKAQDSGASTAVV